MSAQCEMFDVLYPRSIRPERPAFSAAVLWLRLRCRERVYRVSGRQSRIGTRLVGNQTLETIARMRGWTDA